MASANRKPLAQVLVAAALIGVAGIYAVGAGGISSEAGYGGVGPNFLPWVISSVLAVCGVLLLLQALRSGWPGLEADESEPKDWQAFAWVSAGLLLNAALINHAGFILSCALCFALAAQGFRRSAGPLAGPAKVLALDFAMGCAIAAPVFWLFTLGLNVNLPGLTQTGWL
jgi:putative tricarboxylic transport membrane protein